ncbi:MAG: hypothetical protein R3E88_16560 [Myxococcota bacterium]
MSPTVPTSRAHAASRARAASRRRTAGRALAAACAALALGAPGLARAAGDAPTEGWALRTRRDAPSGGFELFTRPVPGSSHPRYRLVAHSPEPVERIARAIVERATEPRHAPSSWTVRVLARDADSVVTHVSMDVPIVSDRDVVIESRWRRDGASFRMDWAPPAGPLPPVAAGVTRIESRGFWEVRAASDGGSLLVYEQHSEIGDSIPSWLVDRLMDDQMAGELESVERIAAHELPAVASPPRPAPAAGGAHERTPSGANAFVD